LPHPAAEHMMIAAFAALISHAPEHPAAAPNQ
jgi:hypothetical protein